MAQYSKKIDRLRCQLMVPNIGTYSSHQTELINWVNQNGGQASKLAYGGDFFNFTFNTQSKIIGGVAAGGLYSRSANSSIRLGYGDIMGGIQFLTNDWMQANILGHFSMMQYTVNGIIPANVPQPLTNLYYLRGLTFGGGPSLQIRIKLKQLDGYSLSLGIEYGILFIDPQAHWKFGYDYVTKNGTHYKGTTIQGPNVDSQLSYLRFSLIFKSG